MTPDQILHLLADGGAISGFAALAVVCVLWAQRVSDLNLTISKQYDEMNRRMDRLVMAMTNLTLTLIAQSPAEARPVFTETLKGILKDQEGE